MLCSHYLWSISRPNKNGYPQYDLSQEVPLPATINRIGKSAAIERIIHKVFNKHDIPLEIVTNKVRELFKSKLWRMGKRFASHGGPGQKKQLSLWKEGKQSTWTLEIDELHVRVVELTSKIATMEKQQAEQAEQAVQLQSQLSTLQLITHRSLNGELHIPKSKKKWNDYTQKHKKKKQKTLAKEVTAVLKICDSSCLIPTKVLFKNKDTDDTATLDIESGQFSTSLEKKIVTASEVLYIKDKFAIPDRAYHKLHLLTPDLPPQHQLTTVAKEYNSQSNVLSTPNGIIGVQQSLEKRLKIILEKHKENLPNQMKIKLSGDGTNLARSMHVITVTFMVLDLEPDCTNHTLAILKASESYVALNDGLSDLVKEMKELQSIEFNGQHIDLSYYLMGDWKFLALVTGIQAANSNHPCVWCKCHKEVKHDMSLEWSIDDVNKGARTLEEAKKYGGQTSKKFSYASNPIFPFIPHNRVVIDPLHLFLRISDNLINLLITELRRIDGISAKKGKNSLLAKYETFLCEECKIPFQWYTLKDTKKSLEWRDLTGPEKPRLFQHINIPRLFPEIKEKKTIQELWDKFYDMYMSIISENPSADTLKKDTQAWVMKYLRVYQTKNVTPYIHAFAMHIHEFVDLYGSLAPFSQQALEKLNDITTIQYMRATNRHHTKERALRQIVLKRNRMEEMENDGMKRQKRSKKCSKCKQTSHNKRTCSLHSLQKGH